ncbi:TPA: hypothetical protein NJ528_002489 [Vibrio parahaemolyticus]|uniref:hypothetical protein n=1 Tax=Vibrio parahaemolyticus TaxID=670 RepID=UPI00235E9F8F|nr:hypothetical protein [Vibrio parahaemolyticus]MBE4105661.1 hypothetical protein [Vibrio parahaemolyticus]HCE3717988.1 hypothetical protein [Vibrio parahaemolyticus]HCG5140282.1 hypothetical protein [Vibrio parahaemolyticus]HCG5519556.1 hypothetical protein [Vibrio parahaemolyticus]HCG6545178.1 hypothetical protein [Vibrio parahaemolyticus]
MPISPEDLLIFAEDIHAKDEDCEVHRRSAIGRYYYAMYHKAKSILKLEPLEYTKSDHENLIRYLQNDARTDEDHNFRELVMLGGYLRQERDRRNLADYELDTAITKINADTSKDTARLLFEKANELVKLSSAS